MNLFKIYVENLTLERLDVRVSSDIAIEREALWGEIAKDWMEFLVRDIFPKLKWSDMVLLFEDMNEQPFLKVDSEDDNSILYYTKTTEKTSLELNDILTRQIKKTISIIHDEGLVIK